MSVASSSPHPQPGHLTLLSPLTPPSLSRAWLTAPHPTLPIVATCSSDKSVRIYSLTSFTLLSTISGGHKRSVRSCAWKPGIKGESVLATGSFDASVGVWKRWDSEDLNPRPERELDFTDKGDTDNADEDEEWRFALVLDGHDSEVKSVDWSAGGNFLATCSRDKSVWIWEEVGEDDFETIAVLQEHTADVKCVAWHPEEEMLASGSYDDEIRLWREEIDDWGCVAVLRGHESTIWAVGWEGVQVKIGGKEIDVQTLPKDGQEWASRRERSGPRLVSCSDDQTIRIWRRKPRDNRPAQNLLSIIRTGGSEEEWVEEARLPSTHERAIYAVAWSHRSGRIVSTGGDGKILVYEERWKTGGGKIEVTATGNSVVNGGSNEDHSTMVEENAVDMNHDTENATEWIAIVELEGTHGVYEINHVCWAPRADRAKSHDDEEVVLSTGDDGVVKVWLLDV
ncbi:Cytosolic iron-sulfur protein assembly protein [Xylographa carneopallida]|nr:Cytosolic iron-sulfur protein assembly protein [Xylographa carneopallida]